MKEISSWENLTAEYGENPENYPSKLQYGGSIWTKVELLRTPTKGKQVVPRLCHGRAVILAYENQAGTLVFFNNRFEKGFLE